MFSGGSQIKKKDTATGIAELYIQGCLRPHFDWVLSEKYPIKGSDIASITSIDNIANPARFGASPKT